MKRLSTLFLVLGLTHSIAWAAPSAKIVIAVQPSATAAELTDQTRELERFLESRLSKDVEILFPTSTAGVIEALRFGHAQAALMGAWPAVLARQKAGAQITLAEIREVMADGKLSEAPSYESFWIVRPDSPYRSLEDLRGKTAAFPNPLSTSGYVAPLARLVEDGLVDAVPAPADAKSFFGEVRFAGGYAQAWEALKRGQADVAVMAADVPEKLFNEAMQNSRVIARQGPLPSHAVVFAREFSGPDRDALSAALQELGAPEHRALMRKFVSGIFLRFAPAGDAHVAPLEKMLAQTGLAFEEKPKK